MVDFDSDARNKDTDTCNVGFTFIDLETIFLLKVPKSFLFDEVIYAESSPFFDQFQINFRLISHARWFMG